MQHLRLKSSVSLAGLGERNERKHTWVNQAHLYQSGAGATRNAYYRVSASNRHQRHLRNRGGISAWQRGASRRASLAAYLLKTASADGAAAGVAAAWPRAARAHRGNGGAWRKRHRRRVQNNA